MTEYKAFLVSEDATGSFIRQIKELPIPPVQEGKTTIKVVFSSLNFKDALSANGNKGVTRTYPFVPGIDASGYVLNSDSPFFKDGDQVIVTGYDLGMNTFGGFGEIIQVPNEWVVPLPSQLSLEESMRLGTAGLTAAASVYELKDKIGSLPILVTGASGGVGSIALKLLQHLKFTVSVVTGKPDSILFKDLPRNNVIERHAFEALDVKPLSGAKFSGAIDTVGGEILNKIFPLVDRKGIITICGMVSGPSIQTTVFPFILRGVRLIGIDSAESPISFKKELWDYLATDWKIDLKMQTKVINLDALDSEINKIYQGLQEGRVVLKHGD
ncbi:MAG: YhdH/YhfP family quinone oxidoreductase [Gammaproteobacteria bacterium]